MYADLLNRMRNISQGSGNLLDHSAVVLSSEGGGGRSCNNNDDTPPSPHSTDNMFSLIAGKAGGLRGGVHIDANRQHATKVLISAMKAAGHTEESLGEVSGSFAGLFG